MREASEDPNLAEVKAVLKKLQTLDMSGEAQPSPAQLPKKSLRRIPSASANQPLGIFERKQAAFTVRNAGSSVWQSVSKRSLLYAAAAAFTVIAGAGLFFGLQTAPTSSPDVGREKSGPVVDKKNESVLLTEARRLLAEGDVASARQRLKQGGPELRAEVAFLLAQSFDPNYLRSLPASNSLPDRAEAERWYRKWYELAVNSGLEMDSGRLQRIIKAMR